MNIIILQNKVRYHPESMKPGTVIADPPVNKFYEVGKNGELRRIKDLKKIELIKSEINGQNQHS